MIKKLQPLLLSLLIGFGASASAAERGYAYVTNQDGGVSVINLDTMEVESNIDIQAKEGAVKITSKMSMLLRSFADSLGLKAKNQVGMESEGDKVMLQSQGNLGFSSQGEIILDTQQKLSLQGSEIDMQATQSDVKITAGSGSIHALSTNNLADPPWQPGAQSAQTDSAPRARNETIAQAVPTIDPQPIIQA